MQQQNDVQTRLTDFDALSSRLSAYLKGYLPDDELILPLTAQVLKYYLLSLEEYEQFSQKRSLKHQFFNLFSNGSYRKTGVPLRGTLKSPLINRGTYFRTKSIDNELDVWLDNHKDESVQIVSLGSGNDTRPFRLLPKHSNLNFIEIDFEESTRIKSLAILSVPKLADLVGVPTNLLLSETNQPKTKKEIDQSSSSLHTDRYHLVSLDLRLLENKKLIEIECLNSIIDTEKPTIIISECCICYMSLESSDAVIKFWRNALPTGLFLIYEPLGGAESQGHDHFNNDNTERRRIGLNTNTTNHGYGVVMVRNLSSRGIEMPTLMVYGTINAQKGRFQKLVSNNTIVETIKDVSDRTPNSEIMRMSRLEMLDEVEELNLINTHYCLIKSYWDSK